MKRVYSYMDTNIDKWEWHIEDTELLNPWFAHFPEHMQNSSIKSNAQRNVFTVEAKGKKYYIKYSHPASLLQKTRSKVSSKSASEFNSAKLLESAGIPTPKVIGWGKRGSKSMLMTEAVENAVNARQFWFSKAVNNPEIQELFLAKFADFMKKFFAAKLYHPDFHPGNLLVSKQNETISFIMIDPYGIIEEPSIQSKIFEMLCILGAFRGELDDQAGIELIKKIFPDYSDEKCAETWQEILIAETKKAIRLWEKRQGRILTDPRDSQVFEQDGKHIRIRKTFAGELAIDLNSVLEKDETLFKIQELPPEEAEAKWLESYQWALHRLPHKLPLAWIKTPNAPDILIREKEHPTLLGQNEIEKRFKLADL